MTRKHLSAICAALMLVLSRTAPAQTQPPITPSSVCGTAQRFKTVRDSAPNLSGIWDFKLDMGSAVSSGIMVLGALDDDYAGALTPSGGAVAIRKLTLKGDAVHMRVASREGDVLFDGYLLATGKEFCGVVTYHGGKLYPMTVTRQETTVPSGSPTRPRGS